MKSTIRLFKAVLVESKTGKTNEQIHRKTLSEGFFFAPEVIGNYSDSELENLFEITKKEIGLNVKQANSSFHKSWQKVRDAE